MSHCSDKDNSYALVLMSLAFSLNKCVLGCVFTIIMFYNGLVALNVFKTANSSLGFIEAVHQE